MKLTSSLTLVFHLKLFQESVFGILTFNGANFNVNLADLMLYVNFQRYISLVSTMSVDSLLFELPTFFFIIFNWDRKRYDDDISFIIN